MSLMVECQEEFAKLHKDTIKIAKIFKMTYNTDLSAALDWEILDDAVHHINNDFVPYPNASMYQLT